MPRPLSRQPTNVLPIDPDKLPDDGTPISFQTTFRKQVGGGDEAPNPTADDFASADWQIRKMGPAGWTFIAQAEGRPYDPILQQEHGPGKYEITPIDPGSGQPIQRLRLIRNVGSAVVQYPDPDESDDDDDRDSDREFGGSGGPPMSEFMRWQMKQAAEERAEARRQQADALRRQQEFEQKQAEREWNRQERQEREDRDRRDREDRERKDRNEFLATLATGAMGLASAWLNRPAPAPQAPAVDPRLDRVERMLESVVNRRTDGGSSMREMLATVAALDTLADRRALRRSPDSDGDDEDEDEDEDGVESVLMDATKRLLGGGELGAGGVDVEAQVERVLQDPAMIGKIAQRNPARVAAAVRAAIEQNPDLEQAMLDAFRKQD